MARVSPEEKARRLAAGVQMYREGYTLLTICMDMKVDHYELRDALMAAGINPSKYRRENKGSSGNAGKAALEAVKDQQKITWDMIREVRSNLKIGDKIKIITEKSRSFDESRTLESLAREAVIVGKGPRFCIVRLVGNGVMDTVYYDDIYNAKKRGLNYVG